MVDELVHTLILLLYLGYLRRDFSTHEAEAAHVKNGIKASLLRSLHPTKQNTLVGNVISKKGIV